VQIELPAGEEEEYRADRTTNDSSAPVPLPRSPDDPELMYSDANIYRNGKKLASILGCWESQKDLDKYLKGDAEFVNWFQQYNMYSKIPRSADAANEQTSLSTVLTRLRVGEANSQRRFSKPDDDDIATWKEPEMLARLLYVLRDNLVDTASGPFHDLEWSEDVIQQRLWFMIQRAKYLRRDKSPREETSATIQDPIMPRISQLSTKSARVIHRVKQKLAAKAKETKGRKGKNPRADKQKQREMDKEAAHAHNEIDDLLKWEEHSVIVEMTDEHWDDLIATVEEEEWYELAESNSTHVSSGSFRKRPPMTPELSAKLNAEILEEAGVQEGNPPRYMPRVSPKLRFWQMYIIVSALTGRRVNDVSNVSQALDSFTDMLAKKVVKIPEPHLMLEGNADLAVEAQLRAEELANVTIGDEVGPGMNMAYDLVPLSMFEQDASLSDVAALLARKRYERTKFQTACRFLRIDPRPSNGKLRPVLTKQTFNAYWWQITGAWNLLKMFYSRLSRGGILGDLVGLGKTFTLGMVMLYVSSPLQKPRMSQCSLAQEDEKMCTVTFLALCIGLASYD
jgi:hypothetical protein